MTDATLTPTRREWLKACVSRRTVEHSASVRPWTPPDENGMEWKNVLQQIEDGQRVLAVPEGATAAIFVFRKPSN